MKMILRFFTALFVVSTLFACSKKSGGENPDLAVNVENGWKLVSWDGSTAISGYVYLRLEEDQTFVLYQQVGDLATYGYRRYTGTYALSEVTDAGLLLVRIPDGKMKMVDIRSAAQPVADVLSVFKDSSRRLWMFTPSAGVVMYELTDGRCTTLLPSVSRDLSETAHPFVYEDERGLVRVYPRGGYLSCYDPKARQLRPYTNPDGSLLTNTVRVYLVDRQKNIW